MDSNSSDGTSEIIKGFKGTKVYNYEGILLGAREFGVKKAKGDFVALIDSDHILEKTTIEKSVKMMKDLDMLLFYERSYHPKKILEILYDADRRLTQNYLSDFIEPIGGTVLPRFYKRKILVDAFKNIPKKTFPLCVAHDHAIIYYEARRISKKVKMLGSEKYPAIWHQEPWSWTNLFKKTYRYGVTTRKLIENGVYPQILKSKNKGRKIKWASLGLSVKSNILRAIRAVPYLYGYYTGKNKKIPNL